MENLFFSCFLLHTRVKSVYYVSSTTEFSQSVSNPLLPLSARASSCLWRTETLFTLKSNAST
jgi:hypothetical protein